MKHLLATIGSKLNTKHRMPKVHAFFRRLFFPEYFVKQYTWTEQSTPTESDPTDSQILDVNQFTPEHAVMPDWRNVQLPEEMRNAEAMTHQEDQKILYSLARDYYQNVGSIVDAGCFLGGSTLALCYGLKANPKYEEFKEKKIVYSYDLFIVEPWTIGIHFPKDTPLNSSFQARFESNIAPVKELVQVNAGDIKAAPLPDRAIEILFIDVSKHWTINDYIVREMFSRLIPGVSIVVQQDYLFPEWSGWLPVTMEYFADYFEIIDHAKDNSAVFFYHTQIPDSMLQDDFFAKMTRQEIFDMGTKANNCWTGYQKELLMGSQDHLAKVLKGEGWPA